MLDQDKYISHLSKFNQYRGLLILYRVHAMAGIPKGDSEVNIAEFFLNKITYVATKLEELEDVVD
ncbi:hypothetical protein KIN20_015663 [Parelaphostrongylus tenuis]|uniref:Uncharacterized protein n=1 Tax=Parelaphostrongylus tenuis TaxID=148309 RepID=A0AAD5N0X6_PARTN|nr:hypothetical protein KIN20_015663 [Parelaphostrongylus tenuis]